MPRPSVIAYGGFEVYDVDAAVTGLVQADFTSFVTRDGADSSVAVAIAEIGNGRYSYSFTPTATGYWAVLIRHATYNPRGWFEDFYVTSAGGTGGVWPLSLAMNERMLARQRFEALTELQRRVDDEEEAAMGLGVLELVEED